MSVSDKVVARAHVLVVDENLEMRQALGRVLEASGIKVGLAQDGKEALDKLRKESFDLVLFDVAKPGIEELATLSRMRKEQPQVRVILVSAGTSWCPQEANDRGATGFLRKPFRISELWQVVEDILKMAG